MERSTQNQVTYAQQAEIIRDLTVRLSQAEHTIGTLREQLKRAQKSSFDAWDYFKKLRHGGTRIEGTSR